MAETDRHTWTHRKREMHLQSAPVETRLTVIPESIPIVIPGHTQGNAITVCTCRNEGDRHPGPGQAQQAFF
jgi:hypothetical protein